MAAREIEQPFDLEQGPLVRFLLYRLSSEDHLLLVNLHAINFTFGTRAYARQFAAVGALLESHDGPAVVAGDFNNWSGPRQRVIEDFAREFGLELTRFEPDWRSRHLGSFVDGTLRRGLRTLDATALPTTRSDHHPLILLLARDPAQPLPDPSQGGER